MPTTGLHVEPSPPAERCVADFSPCATSDGGFSMSPSPTPPRNALNLSGSKHSHTLVGARQINSGRKSESPKVVSIETPLRNAPRCSGGGDSDKASRLRDTWMNMVTVGDIDTTHIDNVIAAACEKEFQREFHALWACLSRSIEQKAAFDSATAAANAAAMRARSFTGPVPGARESSSGNHSSAPSASSTAASWQDQLEPLRCEQRQLASKVADLSEKVSELRDQCGGAIAFFGNVRDTRDRHIACVLGGFQGQVQTNQNAVEDLAKENVKLSEQTTALSSSSLDLELRMRRVEKALTAILGINPSTGLEVLDDDVSLEPLFRAWQPERGGSSQVVEHSSSAKSVSPALSLVRDRLLSIRGTLEGAGRTPATPPTRSVPLASPVFGTRLSLEHEETATRTEQSPLGASGIHLEVSAPSAPSDLAESPDCPRAPSVSPCMRPPICRMAPSSASLRAEVSQASTTKGDVAILRRQQEQLQARVEQGSAELLSVQEEIARLRVTTESELYTMRTSLVNEVSELLATSLSTIEEPLRRAGSQVGDSGLRTSPDTGFKSNRSEKTLSEKQSPSGGSHCSTPSSTSSRRRANPLGCIWPSGHSPAVGGQ